MGPWTMALVVSCRPGDGFAVRAADDYVRLDEDEPTEVTLSAFVTGRTEAPVFEIRLEPEHGRLEQVGGAVWQYTPDPDFAGRDEAVWQASLDGKRDNAVITFEVRPLNDAPIPSVGDPLSAIEDEITSGGLTAIDPDGDEVLTFLLVADAEHGRVDLQPDGRFVYTPDPN
ncbi:MAG: Ig-like domain-containing protein, partial [Myxococcota bacterium]